MRINPILKNEMKLVSRNMRLSWLILIYNGILLFVSAVFLYAMVEPSKNGTLISYGSMVSLYVVMCCAQYGMMFMLVPSLTAGTIAGERTRKTLDLLLVTALRPRQIVFGKLAASIGNVMLLAVSSIPVVALVFIYGGISILEVAGFFFMLGISAVFVGSIGIFFSCYCRRVTSAVILSYLTAAVLLVGTVVILVAAFMVSSVRAADPMGDVTVGKLIYILLLNPAVTFYGMVNMQVGNGMAIANICERFGVELSEIMIVGWTYISMALQLVISFVLLFLSTKKLDPYSD